MSRTTGSRKAWGVRHLLEGLESRVMLSGVAATYLPTVVTSLVSGKNGNGSGPSGLVADSSGDLFGVTTSGGLDNKGTVFEILSGTTTIVTLASFNGNNGASPFGQLTVDSSGNVFGVTKSGGENGKGTVFEVLAGSNTAAGLVSFSAAIGSSTGALVGDGNGNFFGATTGGTNQGGEVFELRLGLGMATLTTVQTFAKGTTPGSQLAVDGSNDLFGTIVTGSGGVFEISSGNLTVTNFAGKGAKATGALVVDGAGDVFGTTTNGGTQNAASVFELANGAGTIQTLASFSKGTAPTGTLALDTAGDLFGATGSGSGGVWELEHGASTIAGIAGLNKSTGQGPTALTLVNNAELFGTASTGGAHGAGTVFDVSLKAATTRLVFTSQPADGTANGTETVTVTIEDPLGHTISTDNSNVTLAIGSGPDGATLGGMTTLQAVNGVATFSGLTLQTTGKYTLTASDTGLTTVSSSAFTISAGAAAQIGFMPQPVDETSGTKFNVTVAVEDTFGNVVTTNNSNVTLSAATGPLGGALSGMLTVKAKNGVAAFKNLSLQVLGNYTLQAAGAGFTVTSNSFNVAGPPTQIVFTEQPTNEIAGATEIVQVALEDADGHIVTADRSQVSLRVAAGTGGGGGTLGKVQAVDGLATFNLVLTKAGRFTLKATNGKLTSGLSDTYTIAPGLAASLKIVSIYPQNTGHAPSAGTIGPVVVDVLDTYGNVVTGASATLAQFPESSGNSNGTIWSSIGAIGTLPAVGTTVTQASTNATGLWEGSDGTNFSILVTNGTFNNSNAITAPGGGGIRTTNGTSGNPKSIKAATIQFQKAINSNSVGWTISGNFSAGDIVTQTNSSGTATGVWEAPEVNGNITLFNILQTSGNVTFDNTDPISGPSGALTANGTTTGNVTSSGSISLTLSTLQNAPTPPIQQVPLITASASPAQGVATFSNLTITSSTGTATTLARGYYWLKVTAPGLTGQTMQIHVS